MLISTVIKLLQEIRDEYGDLPVFSLDDCGLFEPVICIEFHSKEEMQYEGAYIWS